MDSAESGMGATIGMRADTCPDEPAARQPSARDLRDEQLRPHIAAAFDDSGGTFGPRRVWLVLNDGGIPVARCTIERLMRDMKLRSALGRRRR